MEKNKKQFFEFFELAIVIINIYNTIYIDQYASNIPKNS